MGCEVTRYARGHRGMRGRGTERGSEGSSGLGWWCLGLISLLVIIVASCWMLDALAASTSGQQLSREHSTAQQSRQPADLGREERSIREQPPSPIWLEAFLASLRRGHSQLLPNTPHSSRSTQMHVCTCSRHSCQHGIPMCYVASCTRSTLMTRGGKKKRQ